MNFELLMIEFQATVTVLKATREQRVLGQIWIIWAIFG